MPFYCTCYHEDPDLVRRNLVCPNPNCTLLIRQAPQGPRFHRPAQQALPYANPAYNQDNGNQNYPAFPRNVPVPPRHIQPGMFLVPEVPAAPQNFNPCAPPAPRRVRALYNVEPGRPPALMVGQNRQQMNRPAARPEFQIPPPGFGYIAPIMSENYSFNASRCSWCKLKFGVLTFERLTLQNNRADVCELCLARTQMTMERIFGRIEFDNNRNNNFRNIFDFTETGRVLGYMNDMVQCNHCPKKIPREEIVPHVIDIHNGGAFYKCPRNCENYFRNDQILQHSEQCVRQCIICVANGNLNAPLNLISHIKAEHWQYAICGITGCDGVSTEPDRMFNHMMENHVWRLQHV